MSKKTGEDFKQQVIAKGITFWKLRSCSICGIPLHYTFSISRDPVVEFDSQCDCTSGRSVPQQRDWDDLAEHYNMQTDETYINEMNKFWGFKS